MPAAPVSALQDLIEETASDPALDPAERIRRLRRFRDDCTSLAGIVDSLIGDQELRRESAEMNRQKDRALLRENADVRDEMIRRGLASAEQLDAAGYLSHEQLDDRIENGTLEEAFGVVDPAKLAAIAKKRRRNEGRFADELGSAPKLKGRGGSAMPGQGTPNAPGGTSAEATARAKAAAKPAPAQPAPAAQGAPLPKKPPKAPMSPGTQEGIQAIKSAPDIEAALAEVKKYGLDDWPTKGEVATRILGEAADTQEAHSQKIMASPGTKDAPAKSRYTAARRPLHDSIIGHFLGESVAKVLGEDHPHTQTLRSGGRLTPEAKAEVREAAAAARNGEPPAALFMAGGPASGKTSALTASGSEPDASVLVNPDEIKDRIPEYREMVEGGDKFGAAAVHEESSDLGKRLQAETMDLGLNVVVDGTGDSKPGKFAGKMTDMDAAGYTVDVLYVTIPTDDAVVRGTVRAMKSGRWVPTPELRSQHKNVSGNFPDVAALGFVRALKLYDNSGDGPVLIAEGVSGEVTPLDEPLYSQFLEKADE